MDHAGSAFLALFLVFLAAQLGAEAAQRLKAPAVIGEIVPGCLLGPSVLRWVKPSEPLEVIAEIGAVLLLFSVGLETRLADLKKVGKVAAAVGVAGVILPFVVGVVWAQLAGHPTPKAMFVAAAFVATSAGITAHVLSDLGMLGRTESRVILGAAVIDDILAMLLLGVVTGFQGEGRVDVGHLALALVQALGFIGLVALAGTWLMRRGGSKALDAPVSPLSPLTLSLLFCLGLAAAATYIGLAAIIGAFLAGMVIGEADQRHTLEKQIQPVLGLLAPFFFVVTGMKVELLQLGSIPALKLLLTVTLLAVVSKLLGCGLSALSLGKKPALIVGVGMVPRGEVGIIIASLGLGAGVFAGQLYAVIIAMSLLTSLLAPPVLKRLLADTEQAPAA